MKIPYVTFIVDNHEYLYDRYSNEFLRINRQLKQELKGHLRPLSILTKLQNDENILKPYIIDKFSISKFLTTKEKLVNKMYNEINQMVFITTEECNLRCKYCVYSGSYRNVRGHNSEHILSFDTAKRAIDFFFEIAKNSFDKIIAFYGGEALLEFKTIKNIVEYARGFNKDVRFAINTNLTLLTDEILAFLVENKFVITVSLDGPKEIHDHYRITINQKPTYDIVVRNLKKIKEYDEEYYKNHVIINTLIVPHSLEISTVDKFFSQELFSTLPIESFKTLTLNPMDNDFIKEYNYDDFYERFLTYSMDKFMNAHINGKTDFLDMRITYNLYIRGIKTIYYREMNRLDEYSFYWPNGICIPGLRSLLVTSNGSFFPCETFYDLKDFRMGNAQDGFDIKYISKEIEEYIKHANTLCNECWAYRFCPHCYYSALHKGEYSMRKKKTNCHFTKADILNSFKMFIHIYTNNPNAFDYLNKGNAETLYKHMISD